MAGTVNNQRLAGRLIGPAILWAGLAIPAVGSRLTIATVDAEGLYTPDATENPSAYAVGATKDGYDVSIKSSSTDFFIDEQLSPIDSKLQQVEASLKCTLIPIADDKVMQLTSKGFGTYSTSSGYKQNTIGYAADAYTSMALIVPMREDTTKVYVFHLYRAKQVDGRSYKLTNKDMASMPVTFKGYAVPSRSLVDAVGNEWYQI